MGLDIRIMEREEIRCPDCGRLVDQRDLDCTASAGREWYGFLTKIGYYIPYESVSEDQEDWYGKDMALDDDQAKQLAAYAVAHQIYEAASVESVVAKALMHGNTVVVNADW